jgi:cell wall-associated NlpC family hydrolase
MAVLRLRRTRALLVLVSAAVAAALLPVAPATAATPHLIGYVEAAHQSSATHVIAIAGWAADTNRRSVSVHVSVWVDGRRILVTLADVSRPDINAAHHLTGKHGFHVTFTASAGAKSVLIRPYNATGPNVASRNVTQVIVATAGARIITEAKKYVGKTPYVSGGTSPVTGFDCSGYTQYVYRVTNVASLPRTAEQQRQTVRLILVTQARAGDLVFYLSGASAYHIAIYAGNGMQYAAATPQDGIRYQHVWSSAVQYGTDWH